MHGYAWLHTMALIDEDQKILFVKPIQVGHEVTERPSACGLFLPQRISSYFHRSCVIGRADILLGSLTARGLVVLALTLPRRFKSRSHIRLERGSGQLPIAVGQFQWAAALTADW